MQTRQGAGTPRLTSKNMVDKKTPSAESEKKPLELKTAVRR
jgi:hypothetical protein